jgi:hypothetical protein
MKKGTEKNLLTAPKKRRQNETETRPMPRRWGWKEAHSMGSGELRGRCRRRMESARGSHRGVAATSELTSTRCMAPTRWGEERRCTGASRGGYPQRRRVPAGMGGGGGVETQRGGAEGREVGVLGLGCVGARAALKEGGGQRRGEGEVPVAHVSRGSAHASHSGCSGVGPLGSRAHGPWAFALAGPANGLCSQPTFFFLMPLVSH